MEVFCGVQETSQIVQEARQASLDAVEDHVVKSYIELGYRGILECAIFVKKKGVQVNGPTLLREFYNRHGTICSQLQVDNGTLNPRLQDIVRVRYNATAFWSAEEQCVWSMIDQGFKGVVHSSYTLRCIGQEITERSIQNELSTTGRLQNSSLPF